jgi:hypothetical protein
MSEPIKGSMQGPFRMRPLPKPEYYYMQALIKKYRLHDAQECFTVLLALVNEVHSLPHGHEWVINVINSTRSLEENQRVYELP